MADDGDDDLEALRNAVLASMKTKPKNVSTISKNEDGLDNQRVPTLTAPVPDNVQDAHNYSTAGPLESLNPVYAVTNFPRRNSPYHEHNSAPGSPHRKSYGHRGRGGFNGPRNQGAFNVPPRSSNLIVLTATPTKPADKKGNNSNQIVKCAEKPIMVRPQDKWSGSGFVPEPVKPEKPKGPARFSRLESDSDSDDESDVELGNDYLRKPALSSSSDSESESEEDVKNEPKERADTSESESESSPKNRSTSPADDRPKTESPVPSPPASPAPLQNAEQIKIVERKGDSGKSNDEISDSENSLGKPDYHRVPPPAFSPAPSPPPPRPAMSAVSPKTSISKQGREKKESPGDASQDLLTRSSGVKNITDKEKATAKPFSKLSPTDNRQIKFGQSEHRTSQQNTSDEPKIAAKQVRHLSSSKNTGTTSAKCKDNDIASRKRKSSNESSHDKRVKLGNSSRDCSDSNANGGSTDTFTHGSKSPSRSRSRSPVSDSDSQSSSFSASESESGSDSSLRRNKYTASERNKDDIERERRQRMAKERDERRRSRRSGESISHRANETRRYERSRDWPSTQHRESRRSQRHEANFTEETDKRRRNNSSERYTPDRRRNREKYSSNRDTHSSDAKRARRKSPLKTLPPKSNFNSQPGSDSDTESSASESRPKIRSVTQVVKAVSLSQDSHKNRRVTVMEEGAKERPREEEPGRLVSHSKKRNREKSEKRKAERGRPEESSQSTRIIVKSGNRSRSKDARSFLTEMKESGGQPRSDCDDEMEETQNPTINITFNKEPPFEDGAQNRLPVHQRLGLPIKHKKTSTESKGRRVIAEDPFDARQRLKDKRKDKEQKEQMGRNSRSDTVEKVRTPRKVGNAWSTDEEEYLEDVRSPSPAPPMPARGIEQRLGKRRAPSISPDREVGHTSSSGKKRSHRSIEDRLGEQPPKEASDFDVKRKGNPIWSSRPSEAPRSKQKKRTEREKIQALSKTTQKSPPDDEEALNARIQRIQEQNEVIRRRKQEIDREKKKLGYR